MWVSGCGTDVTSADAVFTVNTAPELTLIHPIGLSVWVMMQLWRLMQQEQLSHGSGR